MTSTRQRPPPRIEARPRADGEPEVERILRQVELPTTRADVTMASRRRYEVRTGDDGNDALRIFGADGQVLLRVTVTDDGPVLSVTGVALQLEATRAIRIAAPEISLESEREMTLRAGGDLRAEVAGNHHLRVGGDHRSEASRIEMQASEGPVGVRALGGIALDGEHIGLNDDPLPRPFEWSSIANGGGES
jgi:hypothetical protein